MVQGTKKVEQTLVLADREEAEFSLAVPGKHEDSPSSSWLDMG